jgi:HD superfamily phosphodiesterase
MKCPGQDSRYWKPDHIFEAKCPECSHIVEFFKDDTTRKCNKCGHRFTNPEMDFGCAAYCKFADQCIGTLPSEILAKRDDLFKDRVAIEMKKYFKKDFKRIGHASRVARYAEKIGMAEGGNLAVILASGYLHDIGIHEAEKKYNSTAAKYQEKEGPPIAEEIMKKLGASDDLILEVCDIIGHHHHPRKEETLNFKVLYDADLIANIEDNQKENPIKPEKIKKIIESSFCTKNGKKIATKHFLNK